jgi:hypothetical protein
MLYLYLLHVSDAMCPTKGEFTVSIQGGMVLFHPTLLTRRSPTQSDTNQASHWYSKFSWWWAHRARNMYRIEIKNTKRNCAPIWFYLQEYTRMHGQQNTKWRLQTLPVDSVMSCAGRSLCDGSIIRLEESDRVCVCVCVCVSLNIIRCNNDNNRTPQH